jgi:hypothetical protein
MRTEAATKPNVAPLALCGNLMYIAFTLIPDDWSFDQAGN